MTRTLYENEDTIAAQEKLAAESSRFPKLFAGFKIEHAFERNDFDDPEHPLTLTHEERELEAKATWISDTLAMLLPDDDYWFCPPFGAGGEDDEEEWHECGLVMAGLGTARADIRSADVFAELVMSLRDGAIERMQLADKIERLAGGCA